jgi:hypothetical protein
MEKYNRNKCNADGLVYLRPGDVPKPTKFMAITRKISKLHGETMSAKKMTSTIGIKDPRTVKSYHIALARLKLAQLDLEELTERLKVALHGD